MATIVAKATGNWSATGTWTGDAVPGANDVAQTGAYIVTIDQNVTCTRLEATSSGYFLIDAARTITADFTMASSYTTGGFRCTHTTGTVTLIGAVIRGANLAIRNHTTGAFVLQGAISGAGGGNGAQNFSTGTITITGNVTGGSSGALGVYALGTGAVGITGTVTGGAGSGAHGVYNESTAVITITGNVAGSSGAGSGSVGGYNYSTGTVNISGSATGGTVDTNYGAHNRSTGTVTVDQAVAGTVVGTAGLYGQNSGGITTYKRIGSQTNGNSALYGFCKLALDADYNVIVVKDSSGNDVSMSNDYPAVADVRDDTVYNRTTMTGELVAASAANTLDSAGGTYHAPLAAEVIDTADFGAASGTPGTFAIPPQNKVEDEYQYGAGGVEFTGSLAAGGGGAVSISPVGGSV